jgi:hypothetical protein
MTQPSHCIFYCFTDPDRRNAKETNGRCLDNTNADGRWLVCMDVIDAGRCSKKRKTPVN